MSYVIGRPIEGIGINGNEYILDDNGEIMQFPTISKAKKFLAGFGYTNADIENEGIVFEEYEEDLS